MGREAQSIAILAQELYYNPELRSLVVQNLEDASVGFFNDTLFLDDPSASGYLYGAMIPTLVAMAITDGGYSLKAVMNALKKGGAGLRKMLRELGDKFSGVGNAYPPRYYREDVLAYLEKFPLSLKARIMREISGAQFPEIHSMNMTRHAHFVVNSVGGQSRKVFLWYFKTDIAHQRRGYFKDYMDQEIKQAALQGMGTIEFTMLNVHNRNLIAYFESLPALGWKIQRFNIPNTGPTYILSKSLL